MPCDATPVLAAVREEAAQTRDPDALGRCLVRALKDAMPQASWAGIYWLQGSDLVLGPYEGPATEHTRIPVGEGVCGTAVSTGEDQLVGDVHAVKNYLACTPSVRSEIVVLIRARGRVIGEIDLDAEALDAFDEDDRCTLRAVADVFGALVDPKRAASQG